MFGVQILGSVLHNVCSTYYVPPPPLGLSEFWGSVWTFVILRSGVLDVWRFPTSGGFRRSGVLDVWGFALLGFGRRGPFLDVFFLDT